jgi:hypothetical protein
METNINGDNWQPIAGSAKDTQFPLEWPLTIRFLAFARHEAMTKNLLTHEHAGKFKEPYTSETKSRHAVKRDG